MCATKFLRLEDFLDNQRHGLTIHLEPQGILFAEVSVFVDVCASPHMSIKWWCINSMLDCVCLCIVRGRDVEGRRQNMHGYI